MLRGSVIGAGAIAEHHLPWFATRDDVTLDAVVDASQAVARYAAERHQAAVATTDLDQALARLPDVVHVLTPPVTHPALVRAALEAGAHVVCEKPLALSAGEAEALLDLADANGLLLVENHNYRFNHDTQALCQAVADGVIGTVHDVEVRVALDVTNPAGRAGDPNLRSGVHDLPAGQVHDFLTHLTYLPLLVVPGLEVDDVWARLSNHHGGEGFAYDDLDAVVTGHTRAGAVHVRIRFDAMTRPDRFELEVRGSQGIAAVEFFQRRAWIRRNRPWAGPLGLVADQVVGAVDLGRDALGNLLAKLRGQSAYEGIGVLLDGLYDAVAGRGAVPVSRQDILDASRLIDRIVAAGTDR